MRIDGFDTLVGAELIQDTFLFQQLNFDETLALSQIMVKSERKAGDQIIEEGELGQALYLVEEGKVRVVKGEGDDERELAQLGKGEIFGEMSLIENDLTSASVIAQTDVRLIIITREDFDQLIAEDMNIALKVYKTFCNTLSERLRKTSDKLAHLEQERERKAGGRKKATARKAKSKKKTAGKKGSGKKAAKKKKAAGKKSKSKKKAGKKT